METSYWTGIALFLFWVIVGIATPKYAFTKSRIVIVIDNLTSTLALLGFVWLVINILSPFLMDWLLPAEWIKLSGIFWWISFIGGLLGLLIQEKRF